MDPEEPSKEKEQDDDHQDKKDRTDHATNTSARHFCFQIKKQMKNHFYGLS